MYENKVVWFLNDQVLDREIRASRYTKWRTTADGAPVRQTLGISAVKGYVANVNSVKAVAAIKRGLDPGNIMNSGRLQPSADPFEEWSRIDERPTRNTKAKAQSRA